MRAAMDFIFMLTRDDRTVEDAERVAEVACDLGVRHVGFKDVGIGYAAMQRLIDRIRRAGATSYFEIVSPTSAAARASLATARALDVDCILGGTDLVAAREALGDLARYHPFAGRPTGHPTRLGGGPSDIAADCLAARDAGCAGIDLLAYRATDADPIALVRAARVAWPQARLIVAGSIDTRARIDAIASAGADAFTVGSAVFAHAFAPSLAAQLRSLLEASR